MSDTSIIIIDPERAMTAARQRKDIVAQLIRDEILRPGIDYGAIPGTDNKRTLQKPGAERLCSAFHFDPRFENVSVIERWEGDEPLFFYRIRCSLIHIESGLEVATGIGSCNSRETKYRWRWVKEMDVPERIDKSKLQTRSSVLSEFTFAVDEAKTTGDYSKPAAYWQRFKDAIADGSARTVKKKTKTGKEMDAYEIGGTLYRVPNDEIFDLVNTIDKMACKRALIAAVLIGANASEFFTQDIEDMEGFGVQYGEDVMVSPTPAIVIESPRPSAPAPDKIVTLPPAPEEPPHPVITTQEAKEALGNGSQRRITEDAGNGWATPTTLETLYDGIHKRIEGITKGEILRYAGVDTWERFTAWNAKFSTGRAAVEHILKSWEVDQQPARTKAWTEDEKVIFTNWIRDNFGQSLEAVENAMETVFTDAYKSPIDATHAIVQRAREEQWDVISNTAVYNGQYIEFKSAVGQIRVYGRSTDFKESVGDAYYGANKIEAWTKDNKPKAVEPVRLTWAVKGEGTQSYYLSEKGQQKPAAAAVVPTAPVIPDSDIPF